jgi:hypothetical protein
MSFLHSTELHPFACMQLLLELQPLLLQLQKKKQGGCLAVCQKCVAKKRGDQ